jgi:hypothetical protein
VFSVQPANEAATWLKLVFPPGAETVLDGDDGIPMRSLLVKGRIQIGR